MPISGQWCFHGLHVRIAWLLTRLIEASSMIVAARKVRMVIMYSIFKV